jgi:hypothetical protein
MVRPTFSYLLEMSMVDQNLIDIQTYLPLYSRHISNLKAF